MVGIELTGIYTSAELAELLHVQERVIWALLNSGKLRGVKIGRVWRISGQSLLEYVNDPKSAFIPRSVSKESVIQS